MDKYETVIGLEVHVQLATVTKAFCGCSIKFGAAPNTHVCPVCLGLPGVLPVFNRKVLEYGIKAAIALGCDIQKRMKFDRKNYYYPDLPKNYQISQFDMPLAYKGKVTVSLKDGTAKDIGITRAHVEEDAGKLLHAAGEAASYVDLNRTGTPLLEIVSEPDMRSPEEADAYLNVLKRTIKYLEVSDCNMEEGSLRCDANISVRLAGAKTLGSKVEIKNMNSFKAVRDALAYEEERQRDMLEDGARIAQETRLWDEIKGVTASMRSKEESHDYRYFPEPDLVPFEIPAELVETVRLTMPELPQAKKKRFIEEYALSEKDADVLVEDRCVAEFFEETVKCLPDGQSVSNWVRGEYMMHLNERHTDVKGLGIGASDLARIIQLAKDGKISGLAAKEVLRACIDEKKSPDAIVAERGLEQVSDEGELERIVDNVLAANVKSADDFKKGKENALSFLVGQVMKLSKGKANPKIAGSMLRKKLGMEK